MRRLTLVALLLVAPFSRGAESPSSPPASPALDPASFAQELARLKTSLENAGESPDGLRAFRQSIPGRWQVADGARRFDVPSAPLTTRISKAERQPEFRKQQIKEAGEYLDALAAEVSALDGAAPASRGDAEAKLNGILDRPEYKNARQQSWWERIRARVDQILANALDRIFGKVVGQRSLGRFLLWIGICAAAVLIAYWIFRTWYRAARAAELNLAGAAAPSRSWQEWLYGARDAAAAGDYRGAVHCAYWAGIARLNDDGALARDRSRTPRENLRALTKSKTIVPETLAAKKQALASLTSRLERTWYGAASATETDFRDSLAQLEILGCRL